MDAVRYGADPAILADHVACADLVVLNTCHIREKAAEKVYSDIGRLTKAGRKVGKEPLIAVAGCVAQAEGEEIMARSPAVSMVVGPQAYHRLPEMLDRSMPLSLATARARGEAKTRALLADPELPVTMRASPRGSKK